MTGALLAFLGGCMPAAPVAPQPAVPVVHANDVEWQWLNPARGDQSPAAGTLWGDRDGTGATGFLLRPKDGFASPPHIHNVTYRGVVLQGALHNDDPDAADLWMPTGSFWTQPRGEAHVTAARGDALLAYIEIDEGPYLVRPVSDAFDDGSRPVNVHASNVVWVPTAGAEVAYLWGAATGPQGRFVRLGAGQSGHLAGTDLRVVVVQGTIGVPGAALAVGGYAGPTDGLHVSCTEAPCVVYVRSEGGLTVSAPTRR